MPALRQMRDTLPRPDHLPNYLHPKYDGHADYRTGSQPLHSARSSELDLSCADPYNYGKHAAAPGPNFQSYGGGYFNDPYAPSHLGAPMIQPLQIDSRYTAPQNGYGSHPGYSAAACPEGQFPDEKVTGGVSAQLDYEMEQMTNFVVEKSTGIVKPTSCDRTLFRKWVLQVLNATRLPSATIVLSLSYLALRVRGESAKGNFVTTERGLYQMLTVALILGSKFLDDNTFQNRSWAEVSNIAVRDLNTDEMNWLGGFGHRLHYDNNMSDGFNTWQEQWDAFKSRPRISSTNLHPLDTGFGGGRSGRQNTSPSRYSQNYAPSAMSSIPLDPSRNHASYTPTYSPYDHTWYPRSPSTAPHTGPHTPEYYAGNAWSQARGHPARDAAYEYAMLPHFTPNFQPPLSGLSLGFDCGSIWNCHGPACQCANCRQTQLLHPRHSHVIAA